MSSAEPGLLKPERSSPSVFHFESSMTKGSMSVLAAASATDVPYPLVCVAAILWIMLSGSEREPRSFTGSTSARSPASATDSWDSATQPWPGGEKQRPFTTLAGESCPCWWYVSCEIFPNAGRVMSVLEHVFDLKHDQQCCLSTSHFTPCVSSLLC